MREPRNVGLNALYLDPGVSGGSETYLRQLVPALVESYPDVRFEVATTRRGATSLRAAGWADLLHVVQLPCDDDEPLRRTMVEQALLPRLARKRRWEVLHRLANRAPVWAGTASVVTVLDVIFFHYRTMGAVSTAGMRWAVRTAVQGADAVIAISESAAGEIVSVLELDRDSITSIPLGPGRPPTEAAPDEIEAELPGVDLVPAQHHDSGAHGREA